MADLTREEMEQLIRNRESVMYDGRIITRIEELPSEAELAKGDSSREAAARASIKGQLRALAAQLAVLESAPDEEVDEPNGSTKPATTAGSVEVVSNTPEGDQLRARLSGEVEESAGENETAPAELSSKKTAKKVEAKSSAAKEQEKGE